LKSTSWPNRLQLCERLSDFPFDGIPHHGIADFFSDGQPTRNAVAPAYGSHRLRTGGSPWTPRCEILSEILFLFDTKRFSHALPSNRNHNNTKKISPKWRKTEKFLSPLSSQIGPVHQGIVLSGSFGHILSYSPFKKDIFAFFEILKKKDH
jgi:hypothetical protein